MTRTRIASLCSILLACMTFTTAAAASGRRARVLPYGPRVKGLGKWASLKGTGIAGRVPKSMKDGDRVVVPRPGAQPRLYEMRRGELVPVDELPPQRPANLLPRAAEFT